MVTIRRIPQDQREEQYLRRKYIRPKENKPGKFSTVKTEIGFKLRRGKPITRRRLKAYLRRKLG